MSALITHAGRRPVPGNDPWRAAPSFMRKRLHGRLALLLAGCGLAFGCTENPSEVDEDGPEVSETQTWQIELEQLADGTSSVYPRRGTITLKLRANYVSQPDPTCEGQPVTTFLASVEAVPSRLQESTTGSADGSWNCHGMVASVQLGDGTTYTLNSDYQPHPAGLKWPEGATWTSGVRSGRFRFRFEDGPVRESHMDVHVRNEAARDWRVRLRAPLEIYEPVHIVYGLDGAVVQEEDNVWMSVPAGGAATAAWPSHWARRQAIASSDLAFYGMELWRPGQVNSSPHRCFLAPDHGDRLELIITEDEKLQCGDGWVGSAYIAAARTDLYLRADGGAMQDTVTLVHTGFQYGIRVESVSDPAVSATCASCLENSLVAPKSSVLTVDAAAGAPRNIHDIVVVGLVPTGEPLEFIRFQEIISVWIYELHATPDRDTLAIPAGSSDTTRIQLRRVGFLPGQVLLTMPAPPAGITPVFSESTTEFASSLLELRVDASAVPGTYDVAGCATMVVDPHRPCTPVSVTVVVTEPPPPATIRGNVRVTSLPLDDVAVRLTQGATTVATTTTNANGDYSFTGLAAGTYTVTISGFPSYASFTSTSRNTTVAAGETQVVDFVASYSGDE